MTRALLRPVLLLLALLATAVLASGCGSDDPGSLTAAGGTDASAFPVTITHALGTTTIKAAPTRVVTVGLTDQEPLLALGIKPVGAMDWFGQGTYGKWSWERAGWGGEPATVVSSKTGEVDLEKVAALRPDLILGVYQDLKKDVYDKLAKIAPTVAQAKGTPYTTPWRDMTRTIAKAVGRSADGEALIKKVEARFATFRKAHPEAAQEVALVADAGNAPKSIYPFATTDPRGQLLAELGFRPSAAIDKLAKGTFGTEVANERFDLLDVDRLFLLIDPPAAKRLANDRLFQSLSVARDDHVVELPYYTSTQVGAALAFNSVLSIPTAVDAIERSLAAKG